MSSPDTYIDFIRQVESTNFTPVSPRLLHAAMGLVTEAAEIFETIEIEAAPEGVYVEFDREALIDEMGDILWYAFLAADELNLEDQDGLDLPEACPIALRAFLVTEAANFMDKVKKITFYGKHVEKEFLVNHLNNIYLAVELLAEEFAMSSLDEVIEKNIAKLTERFGDKFSTDAAVNRDKAAEKAAMA